MKLTRINNDINGNPRYVVHYLELLSDKDLLRAREDAPYRNSMSTISTEYSIALKKAKKIGGKKFHNKQFGGGIVFQSYNTYDLIKRINEIKNT